MGEVRCGRCIQHIEHAGFVQVVSTGMIKDPARRWWQFWRNVVCPDCGGLGVVQVASIPVPPMPPRRRCPRCARACVVCDAIEPGE